MVATLLRAGRCTWRALRLRADARPRSGLRRMIHVPMVYDEALADRVPARLAGVEAKLMLGADAIEAALAPIKA
jgi:hypothetical protein